MMVAMLVSSVRYSDLTFLYLSMTAALIRVTACHRPLITASRTVSPFTFFARPPSPSPLACEKTLNNQDDRQSSGKCKRKPG